MSKSPGDITALLGEWQGGNQHALDQLMPRVYKELRRLAQSYLRRQRPGHTLQGTALVHEAYLRLVARCSGVIEATSSRFRLSSFVAYLSVTPGEKWLKSEAEIRSSSRWKKRWTRPPLWIWI
jgi:hypothetical protein